VIHLVEKLVMPIIGIDGDHTGAKRVESQVVEEELRPVLEEEPDAMAAAAATA
jgi:hypothetical protein